MSPNVKTVAIVGAGPSGLSALKGCIDEALRPSCFERSSELGGLWYYTADPLSEGRICVSATTTTVYSKEMISFSDFPMPKEASNFMHHRYGAHHTRSHAYSCMKSSRVDTVRYIKALHPLTH